MPTSCLPNSSLALAVVVLALNTLTACHTDRMMGERSPEINPATSSATPAFIFGVTGHPGKQEAYGGSGTRLSKQFDYLDLLRARYYRIDIGPDSATLNVPAFFTGIVDAADARGITILPVLDARPDFRLTPLSNYNRGLTIGSNFASRYRGRFTHVEAGNELERLSIIGNPEGKVISDYDPIKLSQTTSFLKGMADGIHTGAPGTRVIVNAGFLHYGFFKALDRDGVPYDVYGWHWYSDMEEGRGPFAQLVLPNLTNTSKEIWLTEANRGNTDASPNDPADQASVIARYVREFYSMPRVKALFIYELYEERAFLTATPPSPPQAYFGVVQCVENNCATKSLKPGFDSLRYGIEARRYGYEDYVYSLYKHLNRRDPDASGLSFWTNKFRSAPNDTLGLILQFIPEESYKVFIKDQFVTLLDRDSTNPVDPAGLAYWNDRMRNGLIRTGLITEFCSTPEFWSKAGSTNAGFVDRLYLKLLRKPSSEDPAGRQFWINKMAAGMPKWDVAAAFLSGTLYQTLFVQDQFVGLLDRANRPTASEVSDWVNKMQQGWSQETVIRALLLTPEFVSKAIISGYNRRG